MNRVDFDTELKNNDRLSKMLNHAINETSKHGEPNESRVADVIFCLESIKQICKDQDVKISNSLHKPYKGMGVVTIKGVGVKFTNSDLFSELCRLSDNVEAYPQTNGMLVINFTFYGLIARENKLNKKVN